MMFLLTCDKKLTKSQLSPTHASTKRKITDELKHNAGWYEVREGSTVEVQWTLSRINLPSHSRHLLLEGLSSPRNNLTRCSDAQFDRLLWEKCDLVSNQLMVSIISVLFSLQVLTRSAGESEKSRFQMQITCNNTPII